MGWHALALDCHWIEMDMYFAALGNLLWDKWFFIKKRRWSFSTRCLFGLSISDSTSLNEIRMWVPWGKGGGGRWHLFGEKHCQKQPQIYTSLQLPHRYFVLLLWTEQNKQILKDLHHCMAIHLSSIVVLANTMSLENGVLSLKAQRHDYMEPLQFRWANLTDTLI